MNLKTSLPPVISDAPPGPHRNAMALKLMLGSQLPPYQTPPSKEAPPLSWFGGLTHFCASHVGPPRNSEDRGLRKSGRFSHEDTSSA